MGFHEMIGLTQILIDLGSGFRSRGAHLFCLGINIQSYRVEGVKDL